MLIESQFEKSSVLKRLYSYLFQTRTPQRQIIRNYGQTLSNNSLIFPGSCLIYDRPIKNTWHIINNFIGSICLTHPHLDHIAGFVINSGGLSEDAPKTVIGLKSTIDSISAHIFNGITWPNLSNEGLDPAGLLNYHRVQPRETTPAAQNLTIMPFPISHGEFCKSKHTHKTTSSLSTYTSTAYFIEDQITAKSLLIWGDVEPDAVSTRPQNQPVWEKAAQLYLQKKLCAVFIECSYNSPHEDSLLFGHFAPHHLIHELKEFAKLTGEQNTLTGLPIIITHIKDEDPLHWNTDAFTSREVSSGTGCNLDHDSHSRSQLIIKELSTLAKSKNLECIFDIAVPGYSFNF